MEVESFALARVLTGGSDAEDVNLITHWMITTFEAGGRDAWNIAVTMSSILHHGQQKSISRQGLWLPDERRKAKAVLNQTLDFFLRLVQQRLHYLKRDNPSDTFSFSSLTESNIWKIADNFAKHITKVERSPNAKLIYSYTRRGYKKLAGFLRYQTDDDAPDRGFSNFIKEHSDFIMKRKQDLKDVEKVDRDCRRACSMTVEDDSKLKFEPRVAMNECLQLCRTPSTELEPNPLYRNCRKETVGCTPQNAPNGWDADRYKENDLDKLMRVAHLSVEANRAQKNWELWWDKTFDSGDTSLQKKQAAIESMKILTEHITLPTEYAAATTEPCRSGYIEEENASATRKTCVNKKRVGLVDGHPESKLGLFYHRACMANKMASCKRDHLHQAGCSATCTARDDTDFNYNNPFRQKVFRQSEQTLLYGDNDYKRDAMVGPGDKVRLTDATWYTAKETCVKGCENAVVATGGVSLPFGKQPGVADEIAVRHCKTLCDTNPFKKSNKPNFALEATNAYAKLYMYETDPDRLRLAQKTKGVTAKAVQYTTMFLSFASFWFSFLQAFPLSLAMKLTGAVAGTASVANPALIALVATGLLIVIMMMSGVLVEDAIRRLQKIYDYIEGNPRTLQYLGWTLKWASLLVSALNLFASGNLLVQFGITVALGGAAALGTGADAAIKKDAAKGVANALIDGFTEADKRKNTKVWVGVIGLVRIISAGLDTGSNLSFYLIVLVMLYSLGSNMVSRFKATITPYVEISSNSVLRTGAMA
jgi:hypothetical protein